MGLSTTDLKALLLHYGITDRDRVENYVRLAKESKKPGWWDEYRHLFKPDFVRFLGLEDSAVLIRQFHLLLVPGLLQVPEYIRSLMSAGANTPDEVERGIEVRLIRQGRLRNEELEHFFIIDESVLYRRVADVAGWRKQLTHLRDMAKRPNVTLQILPFKAGYFPGMRSSFQLLELSDQENDYYLTVEQPSGDVYFDEASGAAQGAEHLKIFFQLEDAALPPEETPRVIDEVLAKLEEA
ncbi:transcriptional regulator [Amycolatopsis sp. BJA-103]|nr:transcriptional regulator [Amycolatopsis sp. BJA-103]